MSDRRAAHVDTTPGRDSMTRHRRLVLSTEACRIAGATRRAARVGGCLEWPPAVHGHRGAHVWSGAGARLRGPHLAAAVVGLRRLLARGRRGVAGDIFTRRDGAWDGVHVTFTCGLLCIQRRGRGVLRSSIGLAGVHACTMCPYGRVLTPCPPVDAHVAQHALLDQLRRTCARTLECLEQSHTLLRDLTTRLDSTR
jgi:hypothetical protein